MADPRRHTLSSGWFVSAGSCGCVGTAGGFRLPGKAAPPRKDLSVILTDPRNRGNK